MNRMHLPKRSAKVRRRRESPAQIELTLELPREPRHAEAVEAAKDEEEPVRGVAHVDFFI